MRFLLLVFLIPAFWAAPVVRVKQCPVVLPTDATPRIVGGNEASPRTRSHVVSFYDEGCGGSLLSSTWVLTAAHCLVHDGSMAHISGTNSSNGVEIPVKRVIDHPDYVFPTNDITLVELESPAPSSASFMAVNSNPSVPEDGEYARVAGYGFQEEGFDHDHDGMLRQVDIPVMNTQKCIDRYISVNSYLREDISLTKHICAGYDTGGCDSCTADSGGPLFVYDSQNTPVQIAIVSFGYGCAREVPGGYTRISTYASWMKSVGAVFTEKTSRVARFGDSSHGEEADNSQIEEGEEQIGEGDTEPPLEAAPIPSPGQSPDAVPSSIPLPLDKDTPMATPDETELPEIPNTISISPKPSPPARLPPHIAVNPPPANGRPAFSQGGHGGEGVPRPETSGPASAEPVPTGEDEYNEGAGTSYTDGNNSDPVLSDAMPDESEEDRPEEPQSDTNGNESDTSAEEGTEDRPEEPETDTASSEGKEDGFDDINPESDTSISSEDITPVGNDSSPSNVQKDPDVHRPVSPHPEGGSGSADAQATPSEHEDGSESETENSGGSSGGTNSGSETEGGHVIEDGNSDGSDEGNFNNTEASSESSVMDGSEASEQGEVSSAEEIENIPDQPVGPMHSPQPSLGPLVPPSETEIQGFEELEPSVSPEVTESPEGSSADFDAEGAGLGALPISLITIGSVLILAIAGYLIYYIASRREQ